MKCGNNIIIYIALLILVYFLFSGVIKEGNESPEEADKELSKSGRMYLRGIDNELSRLAKLKSQKKRTPVNIHIGVGEKKSSEIVVDGEKKDGFQNIQWPPTMGKNNNKKSGEKPLGVGKPSEEKFGLQDKSKNNGDIRNFSKFGCSQTDHRGCRSNKFMESPPKIQSQRNGGGKTQSVAAGSYCQDPNAPKWACSKLPEKASSPEELMAVQHHQKLQKNYKQELKNWHEEKDIEQKKYHKKKNNYEKEKLQKKQQDAAEQQAEQEKQRDAEKEKQDQLKGKYGIKQIVYDRDQKISPKLQKELGEGVHEMDRPPQQVIRKGPGQSWYQWFTGKNGKEDPAVKQSSWA